MSFVVITTNQDGTQGLFYYDLVHYGSLQHMRTLQIAKAARFASLAEATAYVKKAKKRKSCEGLSFKVMEVV